MVWWLSQGRSIKDVTQVKPQIWLEIRIVSGLWEYNTSVGYGYIQVDISYWAAAMVLVSDG